MALPWLGWGEDQEVVSDSLLDQEQCGLGLTSFSISPAGSLTRARPWAAGDGLSIKDLQAGRWTLQCWFLDTPHHSSELESRALEWRVG